MDKTYKGTPTTPTIDPTKNVIELVHESVKRLDDLAAARIKSIEEKFKDSDVKYQIQFTAAKEAVGIASAAQEKLVAQALDGTKEAISKADVNTDKRFSLLSEKIDGITNTMNKSTGERGIYVTHSDLSAEMEKLRLSFEGMLRPVVTFMNSQTGKTDQQNITMTHVAAIVGMTSTVILLGLRLTGN
jgi:hypothetical protein